MKMIETFFLLPRFDNEGQPFTDEQINKLRGKIIDKFGGLTVEESASSGYWKEGDKIFKDVNDKYIIALNSLTQIPDLLDLVRQVRKEFKQEAIYLNVNGIVEIIGE
jgi:hypothetical protein